MREAVLLLDVDGTLVDYAAHPDEVLVEPDLVAVLRGLGRLSRGGVALASGRPIAALDRLFAPLVLACVGLHGGEVRTAPGESVLTVGPTVVPASIRGSIDQALRGLAGSFVEDKGAALAVHHRLTAAAATNLQARIARACARDGHWDAIPGHRVIEIRPRGVTKAGGAEVLLAVEPFRSAHAVAIGDDITDIDLFSAIKRHGGTAVSVGTRIAVHADLCLASAHAVRVALRALLAAAERAGRLDVETVREAVVAAAGA